MAIVVEIVAPSSAPEADSARAETLRSIEAVVSTQKTLEDVVRWGLAHRPPLLIEDVIVQDEYTHDVVMPYRGGAYLVYDTT